MLTNPFKNAKKPQFCSFFRSLNESKRQNNNASVHIFTEEVHLGIMPIGGRYRHPPNFGVNISGCDESRKKTRELLESLASYDRLSMDELVCDAINNIVKSMLYKGVSYFEITKDNEGTLSLHNFTTDRLVNFFGLHFQFVPKADRDMWKKNFVVKAFNSIWKIKIPKELGSDSGYRQLLHSLRKNTEMYPRCFDIENITTQPSQFDFNEYINQTKIYQYRLLGLWGGTLRQNSTQYANEYYLIHRKIKFNRAQAVLREHVVEQINTLLDRLKIESEIKIIGLPTVEFIDNQLTKLQAGDLTLIDAMNSTNVS